MARAVELAAVLGVDRAGEAFELAAIAGRSADEDLASILDHLGAHRVPDHVVQSRRGALHATRHWLLGNASANERPSRTGAARRASDDPERDAAALLAKARPTCWPQSRSVDLRVEVAALQLADMDWRRRPGSDRRQTDS
jgi:hypothetical protein